MKNNSLKYLLAAMLLIMAINSVSAAENPDDAYLKDNPYVEEEEANTSPAIADPLAPWNRAMFHFNDKLYFWVLKPTAQGYKAVTPDIVRSGVKNFFHNLTAPIRFVNCLLQGKSEAAGAELGAFMVNTVVGVLGFGNPAAKDPRLKPHEEDFGQTLAVYGVGDGFYIVWPFFGPSTLRDSVAMGGDYFLSPMSYLNSIEASAGIRFYDTINSTTFRIGDYESLKEAAVNPYEAFRNAYIQYRQGKIKE
jgi:phospholipid-binding lipoprotein MlaA